MTAVFIVHPQYLLQLTTKYMFLFSEAHSCDTSLIIPTWMPILYLSRF